MLWLDLRAEPMVISVPAVDPKRYYSVQLMRRQHLQFRLHRQPRDRQRGRATTWSSGRTGRARRRPASRRCSASTTQFALAIFRTQLFDAADIDNVKKVQAGYKAQPLSAFLGQPAPPPLPALDLPEDRQGAREDEFLRIPRLRAAVRARAAQRGVDPRAAGAHRRRPRQDVRLQGPVAGGQGRDPARHEGGRAQGRRGGRRASARTSTAGASARPSATPTSSTATGCCAPPRRKAGIYGNDAVEAMYPHHAHGCATASRSMARKNNYTLTFPAGQLAAGQRVLVGHDVRRQDAVADQEPDRPLPDQLADAART